MRITDIKPINKISREIYEDEKLETCLPAQALTPREIYIGRFLLKNSAAEYYLQVDDIEHEPKRQLRVPQTWATRYSLQYPQERVGLALVRFQPVDADGNPLSRETDLRAVDGEGIIRHKLLDKEDGYIKEVVFDEQSLLAGLAEICENLPVREPAAA